jgi:hypothetical protein
MEVKLVKEKDKALSGKWRWKKSEGLVRKWVHATSKSVYAASKKQS